MARSSVEIQSFIQRVESIVEEIPRLEEAFNSVLRPPKLHLNKEDDDDYESEEGSNYDIYDVEEPVPSIPNSFTYSKDFS